MKCNVLLLILLMFFSTSTFAQRRKKKQEKNDYPKVSTLTIPGTAFLRPLKNEKEAVAFDYKQMNAPLPSFKVIDKDNKDISKEFFQSGGNLLLMMFNPTCEHCEEMTFNFIKNIFLFKKTRILMVAAPMQTHNLEYYNNTTKFSLYANTMTVAIDSAHVIDKLFKYESLPQINFYDASSMRLLHTFVGDTPMDSLKKYIQ